MHNRQGNLNYLRYLLVDAHHSTKLFYFWVFQKREWNCHCVIEKYCCDCFLFAFRVRKFCGGLNETFAFKSSGWRYYCSWHEYQIKNIMFLAHRPARKKKQPTILYRVSLVNSWIRTKPNYRKNQTIENNLKTKWRIMFGLKRRKYKLLLESNVTFDPAHTLEY